MQNSDYVIRYLSLGKLIDLLQTKSIFLNRIDKFEDKTEGEWFAHLAKAANKSINDLFWKCYKSLNKVNKTITKINHPSLDDITKTIQRILTEEEIQDLDISDDMTQVMDPNFFNSVDERIGFLQMVEESYLEGIPTPKEQKKYDRDQINEIKSLKKRAYVSSWFSSDSHSIAMWKLYGVTDEGVAIRVKKNSLKLLKNINESKLKELNAKMLLNDVIYVDNNIGMGQLIDRRLSDEEWIRFRNLLLKHKAYKYEEEYRIIMLLPDKKTNYDYGIKLEVGDLNKFIDSVYLNPLVNKNHWYVNVVREVLKKYNISTKKLKFGEIKTDFS